MRLNVACKYVRTSNPVPLERMVICCIANSLVISTFFAFRFIRMSSFMFSVTGVYKDIQLFFSGVNLC